MKRIISILILIFLLTSIIIPAYATNIDAIQPDGGTIIIGTTEKNTTNYRIISNYDGGKGTIVIIPYTPCQNIVEQTIEQTQEPVQTEPEIQINDESEDTSTIDTNIPADATFAEQIFILTNNKREKEGLADLEYNEELQDAADLRAQESSILFSHSRPNNTNFDTVVDIDFKCLGENLIKSDDINVNAEKLIEAWMDSEGHRRNILTEEYTSMAVGVYKTDNMIYAVQIFMG